MDPGTQRARLIGPGRWHTGRVTVSDDTLGEFLRSRRERISPVDVGLPDHGRRRTPGLRREEVAALAGVSVDYLVRLEQGRDTNPSTSVLTSLASALRLSRDLSSERRMPHIALKYGTMRGAMKVALPRASFA